MVVCDDLLKKQNWKGDNTKSITLNGQEELDCFTGDRGILYRGEIILTGEFYGLVVDEDTEYVHKENSMKSDQFTNFNFTSIIISDSVTYIGYGAFYLCKLTSVSIPPSVTFIGIGAFDDCYMLTSVAFPDSVTSIGMWAFRGCSALKSVTFNSNIDMANKNVFWDCPSLTKIILSDTLKNINTDMFVGNDLIQLKEIEYFGQNIYNDKNFNMETQKMKIPLKRIRRNIILKPKLKWIIPVSVVSALLLSFIVFKVVRRRPRKQNKKNKKKSKK
jgi:hypothetical protein